MDSRLRGNDECNILARLKKVKQPFKKVIVSLLFIAVLIPFTGGCSGGKGYSNSWLYPDDIRTVYVEMFDTGSFRRGHEYDLTDAICKRIEAQTPYKIVSDRNIADSVLSGTLGSVSQGTLAMERESGRPLENEAIASVTVNWKNLSTGDIIIDNDVVYASASFSTFLNQDFEYAAKLAVNKAAQRIVERMQKDFETELE
jgi:hypothetical protein